MNNYKYKISIIMPVYNVEEYVSESIESLLKQTIGFKKNVQLIIVNDGSKDNSGKICLKYKEAYPNNIIFIDQKNQGVSSSRNEGLKHIEGKYVNFLDSDDTWNKKALKKAYDIFENNENVSIVSFRQKYFERSTGYTSLDYKYLKGDRLINCVNEYENIQLSVTSAFFKSSLIKNIAFDSGIKYSEDSLFITNYLIESKCYNMYLVSSIYHNYRKRLSQTSAIQVKDMKDEWYFDTTKKVYLDGFEQIKKNSLQLSAYFSYFIAYEYQFRTILSLKSILDEKKYNEYLNMTYKLFNMVDDKYFIEQHTSNSLIKNINLLIKYDYKNIKRSSKLLNNLDVGVLKSLIKGSLTTYIDFSSYENNKLLIEGHYDIISSDKYNFCMLLNGKEIKLKTEDRIVKCKNMIDNILVCPSFKIELDLKDLKSVSFICNIDGEKITLPIECGDFSHLSEQDNMYYKCDTRIASVKNDKIVIEESRNTFKKEIKLLIKLLKLRKIKAFLLRSIYFITRPFITKKDIMIISDRYSVAGDNGQALFEYMNKIKDPNIKVYFVINSNSKDISKLKSIGNVIYYRSLRYMILFLNSRYIVSSHCEKYTTSVTVKQKKLFSDIYKFKYIFLQHGIINNDLSDWLNKYKVNINMFVTSALNEYDSIVNPDYGYTSNEVKLTGLPRYDKLFKKEKLENKILILPTWRSNLTLSVTSGTQNREYNSNFKNSEYFNFYNNLINDERIIEALKKYNYRMKFTVHPSHSAQIKDYKKNDYVDIESKINYNHEFMTSKLLVSDYSSVTFDFAYLKKPLIYSQFDHDTFFENQFYDKGYFNHKVDGFGEVTTDYDITVNKIIEYIKNDCKMDKKYLKRIDKFFKYHDDKNCERVYNEIKKLK